MAQEIVVRRAKPNDADRIAAFVDRAWRGGSRLDRQTIIERFGGAGFLLAERDGRLIGMLGWRAENLVVRVTDFLVWPASERTAAGRALFSEMEQAAGALQCEVALLFPPQPVPPRLIKFCKTLGYEPKSIASLAKAWREAALEAGLDEGDLVIMKQLRASRTMRPM